jgi:hypothetical protein
MASGWKTSENRGGRTMKQPTEIIDYRNHKPKAPSLKKDIIEGVLCVIGMFICFVMMYMGLEIYSVLFK